MANEIDYIINKEKIELKHLKVLKYKQSFEGIFFILFFFSIMVTIGDAVLQKGQDGIEEVKKITNTETVEPLPFNNEIKMNQLNKFNTVTSDKVVVQEGDTLYDIFKKNSIPYTKENIEKARKLNRNKKNMRKLKIGETIILPKI